MYLGFPLGFPVGGDIPQLKTTRTNVPPAQAEISEQPFVVITDHIEVKAVGEQPFQINQGDAAPELITKVFTDDGYVDLTIFTSIIFTMVDTSGTEISGTATGDDEGTLRYPWAIGDTAVVGSYRGRFVGTLADGRTQSLPTADDIIVEVI